MARHVVLVLALLNLASQGRFMNTSDARAKRDELEGALTPSELCEASAVRRELGARIVSR